MTYGEGAIRHVRVRGECYYCRNEQYAAAVVRVARVLYLVANENKIFLVVSTGRRVGPTGVFERDRTRENYRKQQQRESAVLTGEVWKDVDCTSR